VDVMKKFGVILILAGLSLIGALSFNLAQKDRSVVSVSNREVAFVRWLSTVGTLLVIAGVSATVLDKRP
jgi:hypothetical protein